VYLLADPVAVAWIERVNPRARPLHHFYEVGKPRRETYRQIVDAILDVVRSGNAVCAAFYGHPGICAVPSHEAVRRARAEGFEARMLAAVSAEACLIADLGIDPSAHGWQSYEASEVLLYERTLEPTAALILWQVAVVGNMEFAPNGDTTRVPLLVDYLARWYPPEHEVVLYEASLYAIRGANVQRLPLAELAKVEISPMTTLYVPPLPRRKADGATLRRLELAAS
jgi:Tetrapyrrole (Corrin/Porphyrin) Methylases